MIFANYGEGEIFSSPSNLLKGRDPVFHLISEKTGELSNYGEAGI
jgi:hypothetical protein